MDLLWNLSAIRSVRSWHNNKVNCQLDAIVVHSVIDSCQQYCNHCLGSGVIVAHSYHNQLCLIKILSMEYKNTISRLDYFIVIMISISNLDKSALKSNSGPLFYLKVYGCAVRNEFYWQTTNQKAAILRIIHIWSWSLIIIVKVTNTSLLTLLCLNHENSKQGKCFSKW